MTDSIPGAAIYYEPDGYDTGQPRLMGRQAAGAGFLAGYARYGRTDPIHCFSASDELARHFADRVGSAVSSIKPLHKRNVRWIPHDRPDLLAEAGCLYYPSPVIAALAWQRRHVDQHAYSLCGVTHTTASDTVMESFGTFATAPLQSWDAVICTSKAVRRTVDHVLDEWCGYLAERLGAQTRDAARLQFPVIPLGVDCDAFALDEAAGQALRQKLGIAADAVTALFLGRLTASAKAHPLPMYRGLEAAAANTGRAVHLILAGWFEHEAEEAEFRSLAAAFAPSVTLHILDGRDPELRTAAWSAADLFTSLSDNIQETFGLTPIEAMAAGKPVIISEWNGYRETMEDGVHGLMIPTVSMPPGSGQELASRYRGGVDTYGAYVGRTSQFTAADPEATANAYTRVVGDDGLRRKLGEAGRRHARANFDWSVIVPQYEALWTELAARRSSDDETAVRRTGHAADPLRDDPAAVFAHYPSRTLSDSDMVESGSAANEFEAITSSRLNILANRLMLGRTEIDAIRTAIGNGGQGENVTVSNLLETLPPERHASARRTLVWMQKTGLIRIIPAD